MCVLFSQESTFGYHATHGRSALCRSRRRRTEEQKNQLAALNAGYWEEDFDATAVEVAALPAQFEEPTLEAELANRIWCLEVRPQILCSSLVLVPACCLTCWQVSGLALKWSDLSLLLQAVSERLSRHVLKNWQRFVEGINEVSTIEHDLEASSRVCRRSTKHA